MEGSQNDVILSYLKAGNSLTPMEALKLCGSWALSSRISELNKRLKDNKDGEIICHMVHMNGKMVGQYHYLSQENIDASNSEGASQLQQSVEAAI